MVLLLKNPFESKEITSSIAKKSRMLLPLVGWGKIDSTTIEKGTAGGN